MPLAKEIAEFVQARLEGDDAVELSGIASIVSAAPGDLVFVEDEKNLSRALESKASAVIAGEFATGKSHSKPLLIAAQPRLAFARAAQILCSARSLKPGIHASAIVHPSAQLDQNVALEEHVVIGERVEIGPGTRIGAGSIIGANVSLGRDCTIYPNVTMYPGARLGHRKLEIEDDVEIGANSTVDRGALDVTRIGRGTKIDNLVHVGHNVQIGEDVVIAAQTGLSGSAVVENNVIIGGQVGIADRVRIEEGAILGAQSGIPTKKVIRGKGIVFWGTPARPIREYLKELAVLARLAKRE
jgi:UDP-3-O-[3-hydroxymyristoyl] glucosamine N-acyltransferase